MIIKVGDRVCSEFGCGPVVAITKEWVVHENEYGNEVCLCLKYDAVWISPTGYEQGSDQTKTMEIPECDT